jgi:hypothetical protein
MPSHNYTALSFDPAGFTQAPGIPIEDYADFRHLSFDALNMRASLDLGVLPPGLLVQRQGTIYRVSGWYGYGQRLERQG